MGPLSAILNGLRPFTTMTLAACKCCYDIRTFSTIAFPIRQMADTGLSLLLRRRLKLPIAYCLNGAQLLL